MTFQEQSFEDEDIVVYQGGITRFKIIKSLIKHLDPEIREFVEIRAATDEEKKRYAKNL